jgi:hypothetical protein
MAGAAVTAPRAWWPRSTGPGAVLLASGLLGALAGACAFPTWQVAVETAQVIAGLVTYPPDNPFYTYHTKLWTILHQLCAGLLLAGVSERVVSVLLSGLLGMVSCQAVALTVYALSGRALVAVAAPFLVIVSRASEHGVAYPVFLVNTPHTYGAIGLSTAVLAMALLATGCVRSGAFLLALLPAVHPSIGVWTLVLVGMAALWSLRAGDPPPRAAGPAALAGVAVTGLSLAVQWGLIVDVPDVDPAVAARYFHAFAAFWDGHRFPIELERPGVSLNRAACLVALVWLLNRPDGLTPSARWLLRVAVASALVGLASVFLSWIPPDRVPVLLLQLMPGRVINVNVILLVPLLIGLLYALPARPAVHVTLSLTLLGLLLNTDSMSWDWVDVARRHAWPTFGSWLVCEVAAVAVIALSVATRTASTSRASVTPPTRATGPSILARLAASAAPATLTVSVALTWGMAAPEPLDDRTTDPFWEEVARDPDDGLTAVAGTSFLVQLYTRRPILVNTGALDTLAYAPESGPALDRLLRDVYDLDLFNPPDTIRAGSGSLSFEFNKESWEQFPRERWIAIRREHNVTQVLAYAAYTLDLPIAAETPSHKLYRIPAE